MKRKNILSLLLIAATVLSLLAGAVKTQAAEPEEPLVLASTFTSGTGITAYWYNAQGQLVLKDEKGTRWRTEYTYSESGSLCTQTLYVKDALSAVTEYDEHGNPVLEIAYSMGEETGRMVYENSYDVQGRLTKAVCTAGDASAVTTYTYYHDGSFWVDYATWYKDTPVNHRAAKFAENGLRLALDCDRESGNPQLQREELLLDFRGNPLKKTTQFQAFPGESDCFLQISDYVNTYDDKARLVRSEAYCSSWVNGELDPSMENVLISVKEYSYDAKGNLIRYVETDTRFDSVLLDNTWKYDEQGNVIYFKGGRQTPALEAFFDWYTLDYYSEEVYYTYQPLGEALASAE